MSVRSAPAELWDEWTALPRGSGETDSSELSGLTAALPFKEKKGSVLLSTSRLWAMRRLGWLWKNSVWKNEWNAASSISVPPSMKGKVELSIPSALYEAVTAYKGSDRWAWVRGVWGGCGSLYVPRSGYYLVIRTGAEEAARAARILRGAGIPAAERLYGKHELIVREQYGIVSFLSKIGLVGASLSVEAKSILRSMRGQANRVRNCDTANINKALRAAEEQTRLAAEIFRSGLAETLPRSLKALAEARLEHPEESLSELGRRLSPPVTKSTVKYRWGRLQEFVRNAPHEPDKGIPHSEEEIQ